MSVIIKKKKEQIYFFNKYFLVNKFYLQFYLEKKNLMINQKKNYVFFTF